MIVVSNKYEGARTAFGDTSSSSSVSASRCPSRRSRGAGAGISSIGSSASATAEEAKPRLRAGPALRHRGPAQRGQVVSSQRNPWRRAPAGKHRGRDHQRSGGHPGADSPRSVLLVDTAGIRRPGASRTPTTTACCGPSGWSSAPTWRSWWSTPPPRSGPRPPYRRTGSRCRGRHPGGAQQVGPSGRRCPTGPRPDPRVAGGLRLGPGYPFPLHQRAHRQGIGKVLPTAFELAEARHCTSPRRS